MSKPEGMGHPERSADDRAYAEGGADYGSLLDKMISAFKPKNDREADSARDIIKGFVEQALRPSPPISINVRTTIRYWIADLDHKLSVQLNEILHQPEFQRLEAT